MRNTHIIQKLVVKYKLDHPVSFFTKLRIFRRKARIYTNVHHSAGQRFFGLKSSAKIRYLLALIGIDITPAAGARAVYASMATGLAAFAAIGFFIVNFTIRDVRNIETLSFPIYAVGEPVIRGADGQQKTFTKGMSIAVNDAIELKENESAYFRIDRHAALAWGKTSITIASGKPAIDVELREGNAGFKIDPLQTGESFSVRTAQALIRVKGTMFNVLATDKETTVSVKEGVVSVTQISTGESVDVAAGSTVTVGEKTLLRESTDFEKETLTFIAEKIAELSASTKEMVQPILTDVLEKMPVEKKVEPVKARLTLTDIRAKYGRLDEVTLYSGQMIQGAIISTGDVISIATPDGIRKFSVKDVKGFKSL
jgi:hypothetical protein